MPPKHWSLAYLQQTGHGITAYCEATTGCSHYAPLDLDKLISAFGADFVVTEERDRLIRSLRCARCGSRSVTIGISASDGYSGPLQQR